MKYAWILKHEKMFGIGAMCHLLSVKRSGYYHYKSKGIFVQSRRLQESLLLQAAIIEEFKASRRYSGSRRIKSKLDKDGLLISRARVIRLMKQIGLKVKTKRKFRPQTTDSMHHLPIASNLLNREFSAESVNQKYVGDTTYIPTKEGWLYLATVIDLFSRMIVGWAMDSSMPAALVNRAMSMAIKNRRLKAGLIWHTDRGSQYASEAEFRRHEVSRTIRLEGT